MIDTVVLTISEDKMNKLIIDNFGTPKIYNNYKNSGRSFTVYYRNATKKEMDSCEYVPRFTLYDRFGKRDLRIEFSAPKLIFGNNLTELTNSDFDKIINKLYTFLFANRLCFISKSALANAEVSAIHFSKNIELDYGLYPQMFLKELSKCNVSKKLEINQVDFRNGGKLLKYRCNYCEYAFYDKLADLKGNAKKSDEVDKYIQPTLFSFIEKSITKQILRFEVRLNKKTKIKQVLESVGVEVNLSFNKIFDSEIAKKVLIDSYDSITKGYLPILDTNTEVEKYISDFALNNPRASINKLAMSFGYSILLKTLGTGGFRESINYKYGKNSWYIAKRTMDSFCFKPISNYNLITLLRSRLMSFEWLKLDINQNAT